MEDAALTQSCTPPPPQKKKKLLIKKCCELALTKSRLVILKMGLEQMQQMMYRQNVIYCRGDLSLKLDQNFQVQFDKLIDTRNSVVISQDLYFLLHFAFVNKMYFLLYRISVCAYVGLTFFF